MALEAYLKKLLGLHPTDAEEDLAKYAARKPAEQNQMTVRYPRPLEQDETRNNAEAGIYVDYQVRSLGAIAPGHALAFEFVDEGNVYDPIAIRDGDPLLGGRQIARGFEFEALKISAPKAAIADRSLAYWAQVYECPAAEQERYSLVRYTDAAGQAHFDLNGYPVPGGSESPYVLLGMEVSAASFDPAQIRYLCVAVGYNQYEETTLSLRGLGSFDEASSAAFAFGRSAPECHTLAEVIFAGKLRVPCVVQPTHEWRSRDYRLLEAGKGKVRIEFDYVERNG